VLTLHTLAAVTGFLSIAMAAAWTLAMWTRNGGWADSFWTFSVGIAGMTAALWPAADGAGPSTRQLLVAALAALWSLRLGIHIAARTRSAAEDARYAELRREWGAAHAVRLFWFLEVQALAALPLVIAIALAAHRPDAGLRPADVMGALIVVAGIVGEAIADWQLASFKANPSNKGRLCDAGLWAWTRHPNYFCEWVVWLGWPAIAVDVSGAYPQGLLALAAPALMYVLLVHVSGIPPLEAHMARSRGAAFTAYRSRTPSFFPRPPRDRDA